MNKRKKELYTKSKIKSEFGWSEKCVKYLPEPDGSIHGWYGTYPGWTKETILKTEQKPEVQEILENNKKHREARQRGAEKAVETKREKTIQDIEKIEVYVQKGYSHYQLVNAVREERIFGKHLPDVTDPVNDRQIVNFIRHVLTTYDYNLKSLYQRVGRDEGFEIITRKIYEAIEQAYPKYKKECERQMLEHLNRVGL